jgi:hypothetical protein
MPDSTHSFAVGTGIDSYQNGILPVKTAVNDVRELASPARPSMVAGHHAAYGWTLLCTAGPHRVPRQFFP